MYMKKYVLTRATTKSMITGTLNDWSFLSLTTVFHVAVGNMIQLNLHCSYLVESLIFEHPRKMKIGFKNHVVQEIRGEPTALTEGREQMFWIKLIQSSLRVTKSRFYCVCHLSWQTVTQNILFSWLSAFFTDLPLSQCFLVDQMKKTNLLLSYRWPEMLP